MRAKAREHLPSYREPKGRNPKAELARTFNRERSSAHRFAVSPLVPASGEVSSFLRASTLLVPPRRLATARWARRTMRLTDFCHLIDLRAPVLRAFPIRSAAFTAWNVQESWAPALTGGPSVFTTLENASADRSQTRAACFCLSSSYAVSGVRREQRGRFLPTAPAIDQASDTSVATPSSAG